MEIKAVYWVLIAFKERVFGRHRADDGQCHSNYTCQQVGGTKYQSPWQLAQIFQWREVHSVELILLQFKQAEHRAGPIELPQSDHPS